jgi:hypothetical protein
VRNCPPETRDIEAVRRIGAFAQAMAIYARKLKAAIAAQNHAQLVVLLAEARIGAELKAAQERGEVAKRGGNRGNQYTGGKVGTADFGKPGPEDLGIPRWHAAEMKRLAALGEEAITQAVAEATEEQRRATKAAQERGEVATQANGRPISVGDADTYPATLSDLNIPRQQSSARSVGTRATLSDLNIPSQRATEMKRRGGAARRQHTLSPEGVIARRCRQRRHLLRPTSARAAGTFCGRAGAGGEIGAQGRRSDLVRSADEVWQSPDRGLWHPAPARPPGGLWMRPGGLPATPIAARWRHRPNMVAAFSRVSATPTLGQPSPTSASRASARP